MEIFLPTYANLRRLNLINSKSKLEIILQASNKPIRSTAETKKPTEQISRRTNLQINPEPTNSRTMTYHQYDYIMLTYMTKVKINVAQVKK